MESFVWSSVLKDLRSRYSEFEAEKRKYLHDVFAADISAVQSTLLADLKPGTHKYNDTLSPLLHKWQSDTSSYVPQLLRVTGDRIKRMPVLIIDNVDQLAPEYQAQIFLLAQRVTRVLGCVTVVALREESYYTANVKKTFTAYSSRKFHIASPHFQKMIGHRIEFAIRMVNQQIRTAQSARDEQRQESIRDFLLVVQEAMSHNRKIGRFIKAICQGNMRFALEMFSTFVTSGTTDVDKMLRIYGRDGIYNIAEHEFVKAVMLGDRAYYKEEQSPIANIFNVGSQKNSSHFTGWRLLRVLLTHRGEPTTEGQGYVELSRLVFQFDDLFQNQEDFLHTINRLVARGLIETNTRSTESVEGSSHVRITSGGWYYLRYLASSFAYLDLILQDTPINSSQVEAQLRDSVYQVNNLADREEVKLERVRARFDRVDLFLEYLENEERCERERLELDKLSGPLAKSVMPRIRAEYDADKQWIDRRIRENREKFTDEYAPEVDESEVEMMLGADADEEGDEGTD